MSPVPTKIKFTNFVKTVLKISNQKGYECIYHNGSGSARHFLLKKNGVVVKNFNAHEDNVVWSQDLKKACDALEVTVKEFQNQV